LYGLTHQEACKEISMARHSRRNFLKHAAAAALVGSHAASRASAAEKPPGMKYAMCNEAFEGWPQGKIFRFLAECGYAGVEIAPFTIHTDVTKIPPQRRTQLRKQADEAGIEIVALHWLLAKTEGLHLTSPDKDTRRRTAVYLGELARLCCDLGGSIMVFGSPKQRNLAKGIDRDQGMQYAAEVLKAAVPVLEKTGVVLALEPLSPKATNFLRTAAEAVELAEMVDSPHCKLLLDCNAMTGEPTPIPELIRRHGLQLVHFHANDPNSRGPGMGDLDFVPIFRALRDVKFDGWVSVEVFDYSPGPQRIARESLAYMRGVEAKLPT